MCLTLPDARGSLAGEGLAVDGNRRSFDSLRSLRMTRYQYINIKSKDRKSEDIKGKGVIDIPP
jgi:hypothetical protein